MTHRYRDRAAAGAVLASHLGAYAGRDDVVVLGLVRGGVPVAAAVAAALGVPLDVLVVRKLGVPWAPEVAFGAVGSGGVRVLNEDVAARLEPAETQAVIARETAELRRREARYRGDRPPLDLSHRTAIIVDDGLATGATARAGVAVARVGGARRVVIAAPVGSIEAHAMLRRVTDEVVCPLRPAEFGAVSRYYEDFHQVTDAEVGRLLAGWA